MVDFEKTNNLKMPLLIPNQAGKEFIHNEALILIDALINNGITDYIDTPIETPNIGDIYIIKSIAKDIFKDKENQIVLYDNGWRFIIPKQGLTLYLNSQKKLIVFNGFIWEEITTSNNGDSGEGGGEINPPNPPSDITSLQNLELLGVNTTADIDNKLNVKSDYVLFDNIGTNTRLKVNKATITDTASHLFQTNYSGRAEFGLCGNDDFSFKVSSDGNEWRESFVIDKSTGNVDFKGNITNNGNAIGAGSSSGFNLLSLMPNWSNIINKVVGTNYKADKNGWLYIQGAHTGGTLQPNIAINNILIPFYCNAAANVLNSIFIPIGMNDAYIANGNITIFYFIPCRGEN